MTIEFNRETQSKMIKPISKDFQNTTIQEIPLISTAFCRSVLKQILEINAWKTAGIHGTATGAIRGEVNKNIRSAHWISIEEIPTLKEKFSKKIYSSVLPIINKNHGLALNEFCEAAIIKYEKGGHYKIHTDNGKGLEHRHFTVICYLNDDFSGGKTYFPDFELSITPKTGKALVFPSNYRHAALPVLTGKRYVVVCWLAGTAPIRWI